MPSNYPGMVDNLGLGDGNELTDQVNETAEEKKKRLSRMAQAQVSDLGLGAGLNLLGAFRGQR